MTEMLAYKDIASAGVAVIILLWLAKELFKRLDASSASILQITQQYHASVTLNTAQGVAIEKALDRILDKLEKA